MTRPPGWPTWTPWGSGRRSSTRRCSASTCPRSPIPRRPPSCARAYNDWAVGASPPPGAVACTRRRPAHAVVPTSPSRSCDRAAGLGLRGALFRPGVLQARRRAELRRHAAVGPGRARSRTRAEVAPPAVFIEDIAYRPLWQVADRARRGGVRPPHRSTSPGPTPSPAAGSPSGCRAARRRPHRRRADRLHAGRRPVRHGGAVPRAVRGPARPEDRHPHSAPPGCRWRSRRARPTCGWRGMSHVPVCLEPEEVWERQSIIVDFDSWERPVGRMVERIGEKAAWGSRVPAPRRRRARRGPGHARPEFDVDEATSRPAPGRQRRRAVRPPGAHQRLMGAQCGPRGCAGHTSQGSQEPASCRGLRARR